MADFSASTLEAITLFSGSQNTSVLQELSVPSPTEQQRMVADLRGQFASLSDETILQVLQKNRWDVEASILPLFELAKAAEEKPKFQPILPVETQQIQKEHEISTEPQIELQIVDVPPVIFPSQIILPQAVYLSQIPCQVPSQILHQEIPQSNSFPPRSSSKDLLLASNLRVPQPLPPSNFRASKIVDLQNSGSLIVPPTPVNTWTKDELYAFLKSHPVFYKFADTFLHKNLEGKLLPFLGREDLIEIGMEMSDRASFLKWMQECFNGGSLKSTVLDGDWFEMSQDDPLRSSLDRGDVLLKAEPFRVDAGAALHVDWFHPEVPTKGDWVGLFLKNDPDSAYKSYKTPVEKVGKLVFTSPPVHGDYHFRYFSNYRSCGHSNVVRVGPIYTMTATYNDQTQTIDVEVNKECGKGGYSWVGRFAPDGTRLDWQNLPDVPHSRLSFPMRQVNNSWWYSASPLPETVVFKLSSGNGVLASCIFSSSQIQQIQQNSQSNYQVQSKLDGEAVSLYQSNLVEIPQPQPPSQPSSSTSVQFPVQLGDSSLTQSLHDFITYDEDMNVLAAALKDEGFSESELKPMLVSLGKEKRKTLEDQHKITVNRDRLNERLLKYGLVEKRHVPGDGNCQFASISDQIWDTLDKATEVRKAVIDWLRPKKDWVIPSNGSKLSDYHEGDWDYFCDEMARNGIWGNHLTLIALAEIYASKIRIISSVAGDHHIIDVVPSKVESNRTLLLSHYAEFHYGSLQVLASGRD